MIQMVKFIFGLTFFLTSASVQASSIISADGNLSFKSSALNEGVSVDRFTAANKNDAYISYNSFSDFIVDQPIQILNLPAYEEPAADLIVIHADNVNISSSIEIVGPKADILIIERTGSASGDGTVYCSDCQFINMNRITLTALQEGVGSDLSIAMSEVGELTPSLSSKVMIDELHAPTALALEIIFADIENKSIIDLNQRIDRTGVGSFIGNVNGDETVGTGTVNLFLGQSKWNYEAMEVTGVDSIAGTDLVLGGQIKSPSVRIASTYPLTVNTFFDTRTDLLSTVMYRGELTIVDENVTIETLNLFAPLTLVGDIETEGSVNLSSANEMSISSYSKVHSNSTRILVTNSLYNFGEISSQITNIGAGSFANEGKILSKIQTDIYAADYVFNQYGGVIKSPQILIESEFGVVRNGSKTPYKDKTASAGNLLSYTANYLEELNSTQLGAFYQSNVNTSTDSLVLAPVSTASILGNQIEILGAAFENINPYYVFTGDDGSVEINTEKAKQVRMSADERMMVNVDSYILNSSAIMEMNNSEGELTLVAPLVNNERYRVHSILNKNLKAEVAVYSLPALILSMGDVRIDAIQSVLNNTAYMEVFGNLYINSPTVSSLGYDLELNAGNNKTSSAWLNKYSNNSSSNTQSLGAESYIYTISSASQLETLFFVDGNISASQATGWFSNNQPLYDFAKARIAQRYSDGETVCQGATVEQYYNEENGNYDNYAYKSACKEWTAEGNKFYYESEYSVEIDKQTNELLVRSAQVRVSENCDYGCSGSGYDSEAEFTLFTGGSRYKLTDLLEEYYNSASDWLAEVYEEIRFW